MSQVLPIVFGLLVVAAATGGFTLRARLRRKAIKAGKAVRLGVRLKGTAAPYPSRWTAGALVVDGSLVGWSPRGTDAVLGLGSRQLDVLGVRPRRSREWSLNENALVITARDSSGALVDVAVHEAELENTLAVMREATGDPRGAGQHLPTQRLRRVPVAAGAVLAVAAALTALLAYLYGAGRTTDATVIRNDEAFCSITWSDPWDGRPQRAGVDCAESSQPGTTVRIVALPAPFRGDAIDLYDSHWFSGGALALLWLGGLGGVAARARTRRTHANGYRHTSPAELTPVATLTPEDVSFDTVAAAARSRRLPATASSARGVAATAAHARAGTAWWRIPVLRSFAVGGLLRSIGGLTVLVVALTIGYSWWSTAWDLSRDATAVTTAKVDEWTDGVLPLFPHDLYTLVPVDGREVEALVAAADLPDDPPATVQVRYSTANPASAELVRGSALQRGVLLTAAAAAAAVAWLLWVLIATIRDVRRLQRAARSSGSSEFRFVLTTSVDGDGALVLYDLIGDHPRWLLFLTASELERLPDSGRLRLSGDVREDGVVVAKHGSDTIWPSATLLQAEPVVVCEVVNGLPLDEAA